MLLGFGDSVQHASPIGKYETPNCESISDHAASAAHKDAGHSTVVGTVLRNFLQSNHAGFRIHLSFFLCLRLRPTTDSSTEMTNEPYANGKRNGLVELNTTL